MKGCKKVMKKLGVIAGILLASMSAFNGKSASAQHAIQNRSIRIKCDEERFAEREEK
jgi:hypothetical protein